MRLTNVILIACSFLILHFNVCYGQWMQTNVPYGGSVSTLQSQESICLQDLVMVYFYRPTMAQAGVQPIVDRQILISILLH